MPAISLHLHSFSDWLYGTTLCIVHLRRSFFFLLSFYKVDRMACKLTFQCIYTHTHTHTDRRTVKLTNARKYKIRWRRRRKITIKRQCICVIIIILNVKMDRAVHRRLRLRSRSDLLGYLNVLASVCFKLCIFFLVISIASWLTVHLTDSFYFMKENTLNVLFSCINFVGRSLCQKWMTNGIYE